jgi:hypothetical protein
MGTSSHNPPHGLPPSPRPAPIPMGEGGGGIVSIERIDGGWLVTFSTAAEAEEFMEAGRRQDAMRHAEKTKGGTNDYSTRPSLG